MNAPEVVQQAAATAAAVAVLLGLAWRLARPHVRAFVRSVNGTTELVDRELRPDSGTSLADHARRAATGTEELSGRVEALEEVLASVVEDQARELTLYRSLLTGAGLLVDPHNPRTGRRAADRRGNLAP